MDRSQPIRMPEATEALLDTFKLERVIAVVRANTVDDALWGAEELIHLGFNVIEITFTVPQTEMVIQTLADRYPKVTLGAGTVMNQRDAIKALAAGAQFLVSPVLDDTMVQWGNEQQVPVIPGVMTPSEIYRARKLGAPAVKLFPAVQAGGPSFLKALTEPMGNLPIIPTGGVRLDDVAEYLKNGALAVGIGGHLIPITALSERNRNEIRKRAEKLQSTLHTYQEKHG